MQPMMQSESKYDQRDSKKQRVRGDPLGQNDRAGQRRPHHKQAEDN